MLKKVITHAHIAIQSRAGKLVKVFAVAKLPTNLATELIPK